MKKTVNSLKNKKIENNSSQIQNKCDNQQINISELVKPIDFESVYFQNKNNISNDPNRVLVKIPDNDVKINKVSRKETVYNNGVPTNIHEIFDCNLLAKLCVDFYTSEWTVTCFKDFTYNSSFWTLPNVHDQLTIAKDQKFLIDEDSDKDDESLLTFKTKGSYFESNLAICDRNAYQKHLKHREDELANSTSNAGINHSKAAVPELLSFSLNELSDGTTVLKESMPRDGHEQVIVYLDNVDSLRELGGYWILLSFKGKQSESYLFTGGNDNQKLWANKLKDAIESETKTKLIERPICNESLERSEETVHGMLSKFLQENEQSAVILRKKDHQKILVIYSEIRNQIKMKSQHTPIYDIGIIEKSQLDDFHIRPQVEQSIPKTFIKLTANRFITSVGISDENSNPKGVVPAEPFFISFSLFHIADGRRISEEFFWNPNRPQIEDLLPSDLFAYKFGSHPVHATINGNYDNRTPLNLPTMPDRVLQGTNSFILKVPCLPDQICLFIKSEKVFSGAIGPTVDKYIKSGGSLLKKKDREEELFVENPDVKTGASINKTMAVYCANIGHYRMPFGWAACRLNIKGKNCLRFHKYENNKTSEDDIIKLVQNMMSSNHVDNNASKYTTIPSFVELSFEELTEDKINNMTDVVNYELVGKSRSDLSNASSCCKEVKDFIFDVPKSGNATSHSGNTLRNTYNADSSLSLSSKPNSSYGSTASLQHYSDDNSPGDVTPPGKFAFSNSQIKSINQMKANSSSLGRINGLESTQHKSFDYPDHFINYYGNINQEELVTPNLDFIHTLYIYPRNLNFSNQNVFHRARNLSCFVELRELDKLDGPPLKVFYSRPSRKQPAFDYWSNTSVIYHDSSPTFNEEIKIALPLNLHSKHHLLFRFYHVSCDTAAIPNVREKGSNKKSLETPVGVTWLTLMDQNQNLKSGFFSLPIATQLVPDYLEEKQQSIHSRKDSLWKRSSKIIDDSVIKRHPGSTFRSYISPRSSQDLDDNLSINSQNLEQSFDTNVQWVDGQKLIFTVVIRPETTIFTQNTHLHKFFQVCSEKLDELTNLTTVEKKESIITKPRSGSDPTTPTLVSDDNFLLQTSNKDVEIKNAIKALATVNVTNLIKFFAPTFNQLLHVVVCTTVTHSEISKTAVTSMITLASSLRTPSMESLSSKATKRNTKIIKSYIKFAFDAEKIVPIKVKRTVHESLIQAISELIRPPFRDTNFVNSFLFNSFLFYSIITKSMIQSLTKQSKMTIDKGGDKYFSTSYMDSLHNMIHLIINCILEITSTVSNQSGTNGQLRSNNSLQSLATSANKDLARFISRLFNVIDKGFIFQIIHQYMKIFIARINARSDHREHLCRMKFDFLEIVTNHEHYLPLNLMKIINPSDKGQSVRKRQAPPSLELILSETYCRQHYLAGLLLQEVHRQMSDVFSHNAVRRLPFVILRNLLAKHLFDDRYTNANIQARIAALYLPLVSIILENQKSFSLPGNLHSKVNLINDIYDHSDRSLSARPLSTLSGDTLSTHSSINGSSGDGAGGSVYGLGFGTNSSKSTRSSQVYLGKDGHVEDHWLKQIAGLTDVGNLRTLSTRRNVDSDTSSVHSTSTLTGLDEMHESGDTNSLDDEMVIHTKVPLNSESVVKRSSLQRPPVSNSNSWGRKAGLSLNIKKSVAPTHPSQRATILNKAPNKNHETKSSIYLNDKTQKDVFVCLLHIFHTISSDDLKATICNLTVQERLEFLQLLILSIHHLKYQGRKVINNFESISTGCAKSKIQLRPRGPRSSVTAILDDAEHGDHKAYLEANVSTEVGLIVLDVLSAYCSAFKQEILTYTSDHVIFKKIVDIYLTLLSVNQSEIVLKHVFVSMRVFVSTFAKVLFANCHNVISDLSLHTLRFLDTRFTSVRIEACGFLYRMMRSSYDTFNKPGINRVHLQMIVAVSKLDRTVGIRFKESLNYLKRLAEIEMQKTQSTSINKSRSAAPTNTSKSITIGVHSTTKLSMQTFFEEVSDLTQRIRTVLMATVQMNEHVDDPEMQVDLQYSLAKSYSSNPALRRTWLEKIYAIHNKNNSRAEMAMCKAHIVAMIVEYLRRKEQYSMSCANFKAISPNIPLEESGMRDDSVQLEVHYTKEEVVKLLRELAHEFDAALLWEVLRHVYKLLIPIYERKRDYEQLAEIYQHMADGYIKIKNAESTNQRIIGSYYRVVLYGKPFDSLAGKVFIYRLDSGKQFCVVREELQKLFSKKYGASKVQMVVENHIDRSKLDPEMASIQVTHVEPFFNEDEELERHSMFERQYNISKFMLETPFVKMNQHDIDGVLRSKQTDDLSIQWKRRTILTVEASFPHLKRRLEVISIKEIDFSPIERAIDEIQLKNRQLATHLAYNKSTTISKSSSSSAVSNSNQTVGSSQTRANNIPLLMDMHMSGALLPQVNQGPMAYARVFLHKETQANYSQEKVKQLKIQFISLRRILHQDLQMNPNKMMLVQELSERDHENGKILCGKIQKYVPRTAIVIFSDEVYFHLCESLNKQYFRYWSQKNPPDLHEEFLTLCYLLLRDFYELMSHIQEQKYNAMREALDNYRLELSNLIKEEIIVYEDMLVISTSTLSDDVKRSLQKRISQENGSI